MKNLFLIDAYSLIFRAHYAFIRRPITTSKGFETSAIFGFVRSIQDILKREKPTHIAVSFDPPGGSFRKEIYSEYKANRLDTPEGIIQAVPAIKKILKAYKIPYYEIPNYEADDFIGAMAKEAEKKGFKVYMVTPDKDYGQLVSENIFMYKPKRGGNDIEIIGIPEIKEQYGIDRPEQVIDILALWGDSSDNVPGVPGIGEKTASKLVAQYGNIEGIYKNIDSIKGKIKDSLIENKEQAALARRLVTISLDVPFQWDEKKLIREPENKEELRNLFKEYEFHSILREMDAEERDNRATSNKTSKANPAQMSLFFQEESANEKEETTLFKTINDVEHTYKLVQTSEEINGLVKLLSSSKEFCFDSETSGLEMYSSIIGLSFAIKEHEAYYVPIPKDTEQVKEIFSKLRPVLENKEICKIGQNLKFDINALKQYNIQVQGCLYDTMIMHYLLNPDSRHNMGYMAQALLGYSPVEIESLIGKKSPMQRSMANLLPEQVYEYAAEDADITLQLKNKLYPMLKAEGMFKLYTDIEAPLIYTLADMEYTGVNIDIADLNTLRRTYTIELEKLEDEIREMAEEPMLNVSSPKQLGEVLFEKMDINSGGKAKRTRTKQYSTDEDTLMKLEGKHPIIGKILEFRSLRKFLSSYIETLPTLVNPKTGRVHTSFNQAVTATGRLSSNNPNLQNIPIREAKGREIRKAFIASAPNRVLLSADYSQIELRLMAHMSEDAGMIEAFRNAEDIHTATAAKVFQIAPKDVSREQRNSAKTANFGIIYGISAFGLSQRLNISRTDAKKLIDGYFASYPGVSQYMNNVIIKAQKNSYVETMFGRKRWLRDINSANSLMRGNAERNAINAPIQGTAADIIKIAMNAIHKRIQEEKFESRMILQVHDELVFDVVKSEQEKLTEIIVHEMQTAADLKVPLITEWGVGDNWLDAH